MDFGVTDHCLLCTWDTAIVYISCAQLFTEYFFQWLERLEKEPAKFAPNASFWLHSSSFINIRMFVNINIIFMYLSLRFSHSYNRRLKEYATYKEGNCVVGCVKLRKYGVVSMFLEPGEGFILLLNSAANGHCEIEARQFRRHRVVQFS